MKTFNKWLVIGFAVLAKPLAAQNSVASKTFAPANPVKTSTVSNLPSLDVYATIPVKQCGAGFGANLLSKPFTVMHWDLSHPVQMRLGGEFYWAQMEHRNLSNVPLAAPQTGDARINLTENVLGFNAMARFSMPYSQKIIPYVDVFGGYRGFTSGMNITPNQYQPGYQRSSSQNLSTVAQLNYGATFGLMVSLGPSVKFNAGMMYTYSKSVNEMVDINSVQMNADGVNANQMLTPQGMWIAKVGFTFLLDGSNRSSGCNCNCRSRGGFYRGGGGFYRGGGWGGGASSQVNIGIHPSR
jgi:hypothetical protein